MIICAKYLKNKNAFQFPRFCNISTNNISSILVRCTKEFKTTKCFNSCIKLCLLRMVGLEILIINHIYYGS